MKRLLLLDPDRVTEDEWDAHVNAVHKFFGEDIEWSGDNCGVFIDTLDDWAAPGDTIVIEEGKPRIEKAPRT